MKKKKIEKNYRLAARDFVDTVFAKGYFANGVTRKDMRYVEEYLAFLFQSKVQMAVMSSELLREIRRTITEPYEN